MIGNMGLGAQAYAASFASSASEDVRRKTRTQGTSGQHTASVLGIAVSHQDTQHADAQMQSSIMPDDSNSLAAMQSQVVSAQSMAS